MLNAGITRDGLAVRMSDEDWSAVIDTNLSGAFYTARPALRGMLRRRAGAIVAVSSIVGLIGNPGQANYAAAKAGMIGMVRALAREAGARGVRVNAVAPGYIATDMTAALADEHRDALLAQTPLGRLGDPEDVADAVAFLCSPAAAFVTGAVLSVERRAGDVMSDRRRVVVTGIGLVTSLGIGRAENWEAALAGRSGAGPIASFEPLDTRTTIACEVKGFEPADFMDKRVARRMDRFAQFAVAAGRMALEDAGLSVGDDLAPRIGALVGSGIGGLDTFVSQVTSADGARPGPALAPVHPDGDREHGRGPGLDGAGPAGAAVHHLHGLRVGQPRARRRDRADPQRPRRRDAGRRRGGQRHPGRRRRVQRDAGPVDAQRRPCGREPAVRPRPRRLRDGRGRGDPGARGARPRRGARGGADLRGARATA